MQRSTLAKRAWLLLFAAAAVAYIGGLGQIPLIGPDEPRYAQVAREMFERADPVTPTLGGRTWFEKPALAYWAMMASFLMFGISEWSARLGSALAGLLTILFVWWLGRRIEAAGGEEMRGFGLACAATTATCGGLVIFSRGASFDIFLTATLTAALACFLASELDGDEHQRRRLLVGFYAGVGAALLAKGLVGVVLPAGIIGLYFIFRRRWPRALLKSFWWGGLVALGVAATWYAPVVARHGWKFIDEFFVQHHFARYVSNKYNHPQPFYYYPPVALLLALPWTIFLLEGFTRAARLAWRPENASQRNDINSRADEATGDDAEAASRPLQEATRRPPLEATCSMRLFALAWLLFPVLFFSLSGSKLPGYILPALPGAMLLAGERLSRYLRGENGTRGMRLTGALALLLVLICGGYAVYAGIVSFSIALIIALPCVLAGALALLRPQARRLCAVSLVCAVLLLVALITAFGLQKIAESQSMYALLERARARGYASTPVLQLHDIERTSEFYAAVRITYDAEGQPARLQGPGEVAEALRRQGGAALVIVPLQYISQLTEAAYFETELIGDNGWNALVAVRLKHD
ncbi:MAG TPA: glycosyltransferase family 39 protein [Pyrinomonadaceae bacterium]